jgi:hypothetical protein
MADRKTVAIVGKRWAVKDLATSKNLTVGGSLYLSGCTGLTNIYRAGLDSRGYEFFGARLSNGPRVLAGCRNYSVGEARAHWGPGRVSNRGDCLALVERIAAYFTKAAR